MTAFKIVLMNIGGVLDQRVVATQEEIKGATLDLVANMGSLDVGDIIMVLDAETETDDE